ncbi:putative inactive dehydrogenase EasA [Favolaschia claudopus]|uniref:Inactive dehydrogenase EasA n=1 Tax=Favolaschia claudopus TaxID=2862362 RepID=A0AAV9ZE80_9AGAR
MHSTIESKLFEPIEIGLLHLRHRVVLAPLTRRKADEADVPFLPLVAEYYTQRASKPGTLLISEATTIAPCAAGLPHVPGIWSTKQIKAWKTITDAVHAKGSFFYMQLRAYGRAADPSYLDSREPPFPYVSASDIKLADKERSPRALSATEIKEYVQLFVRGARNAIEAGCDGVEIHGANGYLVDQFLQDVSNKREDEYGGSVENRARFALEIVEAVASAIGAERTAIRLSPWSPFLDMRMPDPLPTFSYLISQLAARHPTLAYIHLVEPRISGNVDIMIDSPGQTESNESLATLWSPRPLIRAGGYTRDTALAAARAPGTLIAFGRRFISNPDLPDRLEKNIPLAPYDRSTFYLVGENSARGYTDQPPV